MRSFDGPESASTEQPMDISGGLTCDRPGLARFPPWAPSSLTAFRTIEDSAAAPGRLQRRPSSDWARQGAEAPALLLLRASGQQEPIRPFLMQLSGNPLRGTSRAISEHVNDHGARPSPHQAECGNPAEFAWLIGPHKEPDECRQSSQLRLLAFQGLHHRSHSHGPSASLSAAPRKRASARCSHL